MAVMPPDGSPPRSAAAAIDRTSVRRGELRIYLGAAPGVGKTFAMLCEAHRRAERGTDVVVGLVETHGRAETAKLIDGLEVVPRRKMEYHGITVEEMDVDAILADCGDLASRHGLDPANARLAVEAMLADQPLPLLGTGKGAS